MHSKNAVTGNPWWSDGLSTAVLEFCLATVFSAATVFLDIISIHLSLDICVGDLKLVEKPQPMTLAPHDFCNIKANVKVASTENGIIFGNIGKSYFLTVIVKGELYWW